ncbi:MAG: hypothetical protein A3D92_14260 [Bacteroidetes bacterium RIFCSPHIGHO2_02_FULL_44_7]|nr:MAG: hypothetical protein A3D92_14260 [Bacteroidetes bacterium RIFCSPHIGHO2_02_FULL_44_7]
MKKYVIIALIILVAGSMIIYPMLKNDPEIETEMAALFTFEENLAAVDGEVVPITIQVNEELTKLELYYNDSLLKTWKNVSSDVQFDLEAGAFGVGTRYIVLMATHNDGTESEDQRLVRVLSDIVPEHLFAESVQEYPHLTSSFTQGLEFHKGQLYEGTGDPSNIGATLLAEVNLITGEHKEGRKMGLDAGIFGEGITILNDKIYQLTYKNGKCYTYSLDPIVITGEFRYSGEGWGLCNDGKQLIMSNGSEELTFRDPESFTTLRTLQVYDNKGPISNLNELEYIDGKIYANVWMSDMVVVIDPNTGKVLQEIDARALAVKGKGNGDVLNGIAFDKSTGKLYMTGKYWSKVFEVRFVENMPLL